MLLFALIPLSVLLSLSTSTLLIDYSAPSPISALGECQLEGNFHRDYIACPGNSSIYIKTGTDPDGKPALHYHRDPRFRRAEVKGAGAYAANKHYYVGYEFRLGNVHEHLAVFQWKNAYDETDSSTYQDAPFFLAFSEVLPTRFSIGYNPPGGKNTYLWSDGSDFSTNTTHNVALAWDTMSGGNSKLEMWLDGTKVLEKDGLTLWTGKCYTKYGIYGGEQGDHDPEGHSNVFDSYVYGVQVSDASLAEVAEYSGLGS
ncbi:hypothetical protein HO133_000537 [Letharia lupina]|uniref:Uncharacterized protein n=1 Tax=Letharia lupina TaxID=560253 RepID=A0A8H6CHP3_9LECA|nr:uncharacterized protein HO133_000537 [Letharia lupina]KAF6223694.1 hypothetical protein HO133_000537 [Letharia lupina]